RINPITFKNNTNARYIRIQVLGSSKTLALAEVEVLGIPKPGEAANIPDACHPKETQIAMFPEKHYKGECLILDLRNYPSPESFGAVGNQFYSLLVGEDIKAKVCPKVEFQGECKEVVTRRSFNEPVLSVKMADYFQLKSTGNQCLDVDRTLMGNAYPLKIDQCAETKNQKWFWTEWGQLRTAGDGCLDLSSEDGVIVTPCKRKSLANDRVQRWVWTNQNEIRTATRNKTCLEADVSENAKSTPVRIAECNYSKNQSWNFAR
ncbi:MAG: RICIN domain-containing protein, partial [Acidobacteria bacterium]|nr:RICIN domain-containing protein [Acidobacteriota bacterium]